MIAMKGLWWLLTTMTAVSALRGLRDVDEPRGHVYSRPPAAYLNSYCANDGMLSFVFRVPHLKLETEPSVLQGVRCSNLGHASRQGFFAYIDDELSGTVSVDCTYNVHGLCECFFKKV